MAFLAKGSNEPFPHPGPAEVIHIDIQLGPDRILADYKIIRSHLGGGMKYNSKGKVVDIGSAAMNIKGRLIHFYPGQWGEEDKNPGWTKMVLGDVTNPPSPPWQDKMWKHR